jgi:hypothetical protein
MTYVAGGTKARHGMKKDRRNRVVEIDKYYRINYLHRS